LVLLSAVALFPAPAAASPAIVPAGFEDSLVTTVSGGPTEVTWAPDGRMLIATKVGQVYVYKNGALVATPALDLAPVMCTNGERAIGDVEVHPNFAVNHYVYVYYTYKKYGTCDESEITGPVNRLSRFTLSDNDVIDPASELVLFDTPPLFKDHHNGGDLQFGKDGYLYVTVGDGGTARFGWAQDPGRLFGKIVRLTGDGTIPADNPFTGPGTARCNVDGVPPVGSSSGTKCQEVFAQGLRNPFRFAFDPNAAGVRFYINDVGQHTWEEIDQGQRGADYGWPVREGPCAKDSTTDCGPPPPGMTNPIYWYQHGINGAAITGGAFVPNGVWPAAYDGKYLFADYVFSKIYVLTPDGAGFFTQPEFATASGVVSMKFGPYGSGQALYYATRDGGEIRRIRFTGSANRAPVARIDASPTSGPTPLDVRFDGSASSDPDGDSLSYEWDFDGNGSVDSTSAVATHTYTAAGTFTARLTVRDGKGGQDSATVRVDPGNTPPTPTIESPPAGQLFAVGQQFTLTGSASDAQDGALGDASLSWEVLRHHETHTHPFLEPTTGNNLPIKAPEPEDLDAASTSYLELRLTATDSRGLSATVTRDLRPKFVDLTFDSVPSGLRLSLNGNSVVTPMTARSWEGYALTVDAPAQTDSSGQGWEFDSWSDGGAASHTITTPPAPTSYVATFRQTTSQTLTFSPTDDAYIRPDSPSTNFGSATSIHVDASPVKDTLLKFSVSGVGSRTVTGAKLRLYCLDGSDRGGDVHRLANPFAAWDERTVTWSNAPAADTATVASLGSVSTGNWYEVDVSQLVTGDGTFSLRMNTSSSNGADFSSEEGTAGLAPQLVVTVGGSSPPADTTPPERPTGLSTTSVAAGRVDLRWDQASDNVGVTGYEVFRDGASLATTGAVTTYSDTTVSPNTSYRYQLRARDAAGNWSPLSDPLQVNTPTVPSTLTFTTTDDAYVKQSSPTKNYGLATSMQVDGSPVKDLLLKFSVSGVGTGGVASAKLRLYCTDGSDRGGDFHRLANPAASWSQATINWNNAPTADPAIAAALGRVLAGTWYELDITPLVAGDGPVSVRVTSPSTNGADFSTKENANFAPQLVVTPR
jgi:glucose/arabinose dehydrogenase/chitodextrinase